EEEIINGEKIPKLKELLDKIDFKHWLCNGTPGRFHGDLHFNNIIKTNDTSFMLIDWRQDFGGIYDYGDIYYDLAKLYHGMIVNHYIVQKDLFTINTNNGNIICDILRPQILVDCESVFFEFLKK